MPKISTIKGEVIASFVSLTLSKMLDMSSRKGDVNRGHCLTCALGLAKVPELSKEKKERLREERQNEKRTAKSTSSSRALPALAEPVHAAPVEESGDGRLGALALAAVPIGFLALVEAGDDVLHHAVPHALDIVVVESGALAVAASVDGCRCLLALW